jgi:hypothetical protein
MNMEPRVGEVGEGDPMILLNQAEERHVYPIHCDDLGLPPLSRRQSALESGEPVSRGDTVGHHLMPFVNEACRECVVGTLAGP